MFEFIGALLRAEPITVVPLFIKLRIGTFDIQENDSATQFGWWVVIMITSPVSDGSMHHQGVSEFVTT